MFYVQAKYSKSNINDCHQPLSGNPSARDFAIVRKTLVHFGINLIVARTRGESVHRKPQRLISDQRISALLNFRTCRSLFHFSPFTVEPSHPPSPAIPLPPAVRPLTCTRARAAAPLLEFVRFCARSNFISFTPGFPRAAGWLLDSYVLLPGPWSTELFLGN